MLDASDVLEAAHRIRSHVRRTPMLDIGEGKTPLWLKCEFMQHTGSFKARGAFNRILTALERGELDSAVGIVAASGGNAGLAHAYAALRLGVPATVFVPETAPRVKLERLARFGAHVRPVGTEYAHAFAAATDFVEETGALFCHAYDQQEIVAGAGTVAQEILEDDPSVDTIIVAVGGGGLLAGVLAAAGRARVVGVEPESIPTLNAALTQGRPVDVDVSGIAADSLGARRVGNICFEIATRVGVSSRLVADRDIVAARARLWHEYRIAAEPGAATAYASITAGAYVPAPEERVAVVVCGANTDPASLAAGSAHTGDTPLPAGA